MKAPLFLTAAGMAALLSTSALAEITNAQTKTLPDNTYVTVSGTVESVQNEREFTLRDSTGTMGIDLAPNQSIVVEKGEYLTVSGTVDKDLGLVDVDANNIYVHKGFTRSISDAFKGMPGVSTIDAQAFNIKDLPAEGTVKITGIVSDVDNEKEFTLQDDSGTINVDIASAVNAQLAKGATVTVIGRVDRSLLGKEINATQVLVVADAGQ